MSEQSQLNFNIPKIKRQLSKDNLRNVSLTSRDATELQQAIERCYLDTEARGQWEVKAIQTFDNRKLETEYREKRAELKDLGRHARELTEQYAFLYIKDSSHLIPKIAKNGLLARSGPFNGLGDSNSGVYVCKHPDVQLKLAEHRDERTVNICVFKVTLGRCKAVQVASASETAIEPTPNYDSHVSVSAPSTSTIHNLQLQRSQLYLYEYTDEALPSERPRHCLPYALIQYHKTGSSTSAYGQQSRSSYGTKTSASADYSWKAQGSSTGPQKSRKTRPDGAQAPRRSSYESASDFSRSGGNPNGLAYKVPGGREDPRLARQRNSTDSIDPRAVVQDPRLSAADLRVMVQDPRLSAADPRTKIQDPRLSAADPRAMVQDPRLPAMDPRAMVQDPRFAVNDPRNMADSRTALADPRLAAGDPRNKNLKLSTGQMGLPGVQIPQLPSDPKVISPEMKSMIKAVEQLWGTSRQDEIALTSIAQADNSVLRQVQEQMEQKKAEAKEKRKKISLADYSTRFKNNDKGSSGKLVSSGLPSITDIPVPTVPVTAVDVVPDLNTVSSEPETSIPSSSFSTVSSESLNKIYPPSRFSQAGSLDSTKLCSLATSTDSMTSSHFPSTITSVTSSAEHLPISQASLPSSHATPQALESESITPKLDDAKEEDPATASFVSSGSHDFVLFQEDKDFVPKRVLTPIKESQVIYSPKGSPNYKDPYAAVKRSVHVDLFKPTVPSPLSSPVKKDPNNIPAFPKQLSRSQSSEEVSANINDLVESENITNSVYEKTFQEELSKRFHGNESASTSFSKLDSLFQGTDTDSSYCSELQDVKQSPLYDSEPRQTMQELQSSHMLLSKPVARLKQENELSQGSSLGLPVQEKDSGLPSYNSPLPKTNVQGIQGSPVIISSPGSLPPYSPSSGSSMSVSETEQPSTHLYKNINKAYVSNLVSKLQSYGDIDVKDIVVKMGLKGAPVPQSPKHQVQSERYREISGEVYRSPTSVLQRQGFPDFVSQDINPQTQDSRWDQWNTSSRRRDSDYPEDRGHRSDRYSWSSRDSDHGGSWRDYEEDVDYRRRSNRRPRFDEDDRWSHESRYDRRFNARRYSPRHEEAHQFGDTDYRSSRYRSSPRRSKREGGEEYVVRDRDERYGEWRRPSSEDKYPTRSDDSQSDLDQWSHVDLHQGRGTDFSEGVWMAPRIEGGFAPSDTGLTPVKSQLQDDPSFGSPKNDISAGFQNLDTLSTNDFDEVNNVKKLLFPHHEDESALTRNPEKSYDEVKTENSVTVSCEMPSVVSKQSDLRNPVQARSWTEVIEQKNFMDIKDEQPEEEEEEEEGSLQSSFQSSESNKSLEASKKLKKKKVARDMAGYKKRRKKKKKFMGRGASLAGFSPCPSVSPVHDFEQDFDYADFSFDQPHLYVETAPTSDEDTRHYFPENFSPGGENQHENGESAEFQPKVLLVDCLKVTQSPPKSCVVCEEAGSSLEPYKHFILPGEESFTSVKEEPCADSKENIWQIKMDYEEHLPRGTSYYMENCIPGLDLIKPETKSDICVNKTKVTMQSTPAKEENYVKLEKKPEINSKGSYSDARGVSYNSIEGDRQCKTSSSMVKETRILTEEKVSDEASKPKKLSNEDLDINGTHNAFSPVKNLMKRKLSITLCVGGKKKKPELKRNIFESKESLHEIPATTSESTISEVKPTMQIASQTKSVPSKIKTTLTSAMQTVSRTTPASEVETSSASSASTASPASESLTRTPKVQYKVGVKKSSLCSPLVTDITGSLESRTKSIIKTATISGETITPVPKAKSGQSIPVLGRKRVNTTPVSAKAQPTLENSSSHSQEKANAKLKNAQNLTGSLVGPIPVLAPTVSVNSPRMPFTPLRNTGSVSPLVSSTQGNVHGRAPVSVPLQRLHAPMVPPPSLRQSVPLTNFPLVSASGLRPVVPNNFSQPPPVLSTAVPPPVLPVVSQGTMIGQQQPGLTRPQAGPQPIRPLQMHNIQSTSPFMSVNQQIPRTSFSVRQQSPSSIPMLRTIPLTQQTPIQQIQPRMTFPPPNQSGYGHHNIGVPPRAGSSIPVIGQNMIRQPTPQPVPPPSSVPLPFTPNVPVFNPSQPPPRMPNRPISTLVQIPTAEPKKSNDPADWFAHMFAPKPREPSLPREITPEFSKSRESTPDYSTDRGGNSESASSSTSPLRQVHFLGEHSRDVHVGEAVHSGKDIKALDSPLRRVVMRSSSSRTNAAHSSPECTSSDQTSSSTSGTPCKSKLSTKPLDFLSKEREKILNALQNLPASASDNEDIHDSPDERCNSSPHESRDLDKRLNTGERKIKLDPVFIQVDSSDVRKVMLQDDRHTGVKKHDETEGKRRAMKRPMVEWSDMLTSKQKKQTGPTYSHRQRELVDYNDELELYKSEQSKIEPVEMPDDSSSASGDSVEDLVEVGSNPGGHKVTESLTIESYLKVRLGVADPSKVRDRIPWPMDTVLADQIKHKRRRMVQKAKVVAAYYKKKLEKGMEQEEEPVEDSEPSCMVSAKERKLEDFTKDQILLELQVVQECVKRCSESSQNDCSAQITESTTNSEHVTNDPDLSHYVKSSILAFEKNVLIAQENVFRAMGVEPPANLLCQPGPVDVGNISEIGDVPVRKEKLQERELEALQQVASDLMEGFQKLNSIGRPHQKVPDDILLNSERKKFHSEEGCFLILLSAISKKPYSRLMSLKMNIEKLLRDKMDAVANNKTATAEHLKKEINNCHDMRRKLLTTFTGSLGRKRLRKLNLVKTKYHVCISFLRKELGVDGLERLEYICTLFQAINTHITIVQQELASPTL